MFLSGCTGSIGDGQVSADFGEQSRQAFLKVQLTLEAANLDFSNVVEITNYHVELRKYLEIFKTVKDEFIVEPYPAWTAIGVSELAAEGALIEIKAVAMVF